uniref:Uncharacterized protein n=1 Tax=Anopheles albimanus TaxID=7167 RepID=A0A8W7K7J1_ANOAL
MERNGNNLQLKNLQIVAGSELPVVAYADKSDKSARCWLEGVVTASIEENRRNESTEGTFSNYTNGNLCRCGNSYNAVPFSSGPALVQEAMFPAIHREPALLGFPFGQRWLLYNQPQHQCWPAIGSTASEPLLTQKITQVTINRVTVTNVSMRTR